MDLLITIDESRAKHFLAFLKELDFVEVKKAARKPAQKKKNPQKDFPYFDSCPEWDIDASELRKQSNVRLKAKW